jgi:hypothetical protein
VTAGARFSLRILVLASLVGAVGSLEFARAQSPSDLVSAEAALEFAPDALECAPDRGTQGRSAPNALGTAHRATSEVPVAKPRGASPAAGARVRYDRLVVSCLSVLALSTGHLYCRHDRPLWRTPGLLRVGGASSDESDSSIA